jgi:hypothetical protein
VSSFRFVQFEFGFLLGPSDGRFIVRKDLASEVEHILVLGTLGALERRLLKGRKGNLVTAAEPEPVPTSRATVIDPEEVTAAEGAAWLNAARRDKEFADDEVDGALRVLNQALHAHRLAKSDPHSRDASDNVALVTRLGFGSGEDVADGHYSEAWELPRGARRRAKRSMDAPDERFAALLGGREPIYACEELVLRARVDLDAGRMREAALQARIALETVLAELGSEIPGNRRPALEGDRELAGEAANQAVRGDLEPQLAEPLEEFIARMEAALRARRMADSL